MNWFTETKTPGVQLPSPSLNDNIKAPNLYKTSKELRAAVNVALSLGQPLLLTGDPGSGKSQLADHLAWFFDLELEVLPIQTTSIARDLYYHYDALGHFQYNQNNQKPLEIPQLEDQFIHFCGLGRAIKDNKRMVVLIDEIDKAPRDLPNDLLTALDRLSFKVPEIGRREPYTCNKENLPIVIITSNSEKNLPDPFLRRVVYYHIPFPDDQLLLDILSEKITPLKKGQPEALRDHFKSLRADELRLEKKPTTSELLLWADLLIKLGFDPLDLKDLKELKDLKKLNDDQKAILKQSYTVLVKTQEDLEKVSNF